MSAHREAVRAARSIVVKIGTTALTNPAGLFDATRLAALADAGGGLLGGQVGGPARQTQRFDPGGDGSRGDDHHVGAGLHPGLDRVDQLG